MNKIGQKALLLLLAVVCMFCFAGCHRFEPKPIQWSSSQSDSDTVDPNISNDKTDSEAVKVEELILGDVLPVPKKAEGEVIINTDTELFVNLTPHGNDVGEYMDACEEKGFVFRYRSDDDIYNNGGEAVSADGYLLNIRDPYDQSGWFFRIHLEKMSEVQWSDHKVGQILPEPVSLKGIVSTEIDTRFDCYILNITKQDFLNYVIACEDKGFVVEGRSKEHDYYLLKNPEGQELKLIYFTNDIMCVDLYQWQVASTPSPTPFETPSET